MTMRAWLVAAIAALLVPQAAQAGLERQIIGAEQDHLVEATGCNQFYRTTYTSFAAEVNAQERREIALDVVAPLRVVASHEGGVSIRGWNRPSARLIVCKFAVAGTRTSAQRVLAAISVTHVNGEIVAHGPNIDETQAWWVNMVVYVPRRASVDVRAAKGGVAIRNMEGRVTAHATTGGISVSKSSGNYKISTDSGGITLDRISGKVQADSREGAIALKLEPSEVVSIEARTGGDGDILCHLQGCETGLGTWAADRKRLRVGSATPSIRLSTTDAAIIIDHVR
jgi:hypothetical protein